MEKIVEALWIFLLSLLLGLLLALPTMLLLNWLVPALIPGAAGWSITWLQAFGLNMLCNFLFGGVSSGKKDK